MRVYVGKREYDLNKFRWFYSPLSKKYMAEFKIIIFWWFGYNWYFCLKKGE